jgi:hypothetical protein
VQSVRSVINPGKLGHLGPLSDFREQQAAWAARHTAM